MLIYCSNIVEMYHSLAKFVRTTFVGPAPNSDQILLEEKDFEKVRLIPHDFTVVAFAELLAPACIFSSSAATALISLFHSSLISPFSLFLLQNFYLLPANSPLLLHQLFSFSSISPLIALFLYFSLFTF